MKTRYEVRQMENNKVVKRFNTTEEAETWLNNMFPSIDKRKNYYVSLPIEETLEELFKDYYGNYKPNLEWEDLSDDIMEEYKDAYETLAQGEEQMIPNQKEKRVWTLDEVLELFGTNFDAHDKEYLTLLAIKNKGDWDGISKDLHNHIHIEDYLNRDSVLLNLYNSDVKVVTIFEDEYPEILRKSYKAPFVLFYVGDLNLLNKVEESTGLLGKETLVDVLVPKGNIVTLAGKEVIEVKSKDSAVFVSTAFGSEMPKIDSARLFASLSARVFLNQPKEKTFTAFVIMFGIRFNMDIISTPSSWVEEMGGDEGAITFIDSFDGVWSKN